MKTFKKKYAPGDTTKLAEFEMADNALSEVSWSVMLLSGAQRHYSQCFRLTSSEQLSCWLEG